ncbi:MAG TPA: ATP-binding protein [bacterium]|nr:ATP-binding protein [bacterium]
MKLTKARNIKKALKYFDPQKPLWDWRELLSFYVPRNGNHLDEMQRIFLSASDFPKLLFSGPPGCGKATELAKLRESLMTKFHVVLISAKQMTNNFEVAPEIVLGTILRHIGDVVKKKNEKFFKQEIEPLINRTLGWETKIADVDPADRKLDFSSFEKHEKGEASFRGEFKLVSKTIGRPTANEIIIAINKASAELASRRFLVFSGKKVLLLMADMDKLEFESARNIFIKSFLHFIKIDCCAVFTLPLAIKYDPDFVRMYRNFSGIYYLQNYQTYNREGDINYQDRQKLSEVIYNRLHRDIIYPEVVDRVIRLSGGILFELINIIRHCCIIALREKINYIDAEVLDEAIERIRSNYRIALNESDIKNLRLIHQQKTFSDTTSLTRLLNQYSITEYGSGDNAWYDVNPVLLPVLTKYEIAEE